MAERNYRREYLKFHSSEKSKLDRAARNRVRRKLEKQGRVRKNDGRDVDHRDGNPRNGAASNLRVVPKSVNRAKH
jgi:hypothetical protein